MSIIAVDKSNSRQKARKGWLIACATGAWLLLAANSLPYLYTPPALSDAKLTVYRDVVTFMMNHPEIEDLQFSARGTVELFHNNKWVDYRDFLTSREVIQTEVLLKRLPQVGCRFAWTEGGLILFQPARHLFFPSPAGVLYSLRGEDPNRNLDRNVVSLRPFKRISGHWYVWRGRFEKRLPRGALDLTLKKPTGLEPAS